MTAFGCAGLLAVTEQLDPHFIFIRSDRYLLPVVVQPSQARSTCTCFWGFSVGARRRLHVLVHRLRIERKRSEVIEEDVTRAETSSISCSSTSFGSCTVAMKWKAPSRGL